MAKVKFTYDRTLWLLSAVIIIVLAIFLIMGFSSCSNAKQVTRQMDNTAEIKRKFAEDDKQVLAKGIEEYVKSHPCIFPEINLDSLCESIHGTNGFASDFLNGGDIESNTSTTLPKVTAAVPCKPHNILVPVEDNRRLNLLCDSVTELNRRLSECSGNINGRKEAIKEVVQESKPGPWNFNRWAYMFFGFLLLYIIKVVIFKRI